MDFLSNLVLHFITQYETLLLSMKLYYFHTQNKYNSKRIIQPLQISPNYVVGLHRYHVIQQRGMTEAVQEYYK